MREGTEAQGIKASSVERLNALDDAEAARVLGTVCGSTRWVREMAAGRPYATVDGLLAAGDRAWFALERADWIEAFSHHPRIGERNLSQAKFAATAVQSSREQSGMVGATEAEREEFARGNAEYERLFGHVFLICATGKSAREMLASLRERLKNTAEAELKNAAGEQAKIIRLRLEKWLNT